MYLEGMTKRQTFKAIVIDPDGSHELVDVPADDLASLRFMQGKVGGYIEGVPGWSDGQPDRMADVLFMCNEHGKFENLPVNRRATALWWTLNPEVVGVDHLRGVVVVTGSADEDGDTLSVPQQVVDLVEAGGRQ